MRRWGDRIRWGFGELVEVLVFYFTGNGVYGLPGTALYETLLVFFVQLIDPDIDFLILCMEYIGEEKKYC